MIGLIDPSVTELLRDPRDSGDFGENIGTDAPCRASRDPAYIDLYVDNTLIGYFRRSPMELGGSCIGRFVRVAYDHQIQLARIEGRRYYYVTK